LLFQPTLTAGGEWYIVGNRMASADYIETRGIASDASGDPSPAFAEVLPFIGKALLRIVTPQPFDADLLAAACPPLPLSTFSR
jgi:hypothetical protein